MGGSSLAEELDDSSGRTISPAVTSSESILTEDELFGKSSKAEDTPLTGAILLEDTFFWSAEDEIASSDEEEFSSGAEMLPLVGSGSQAVSETSAETPNAAARRLWVDTDHSRFFSTLLLRITSSYSFLLHQYRLFYLLKSSPSRTRRKCVTRTYQK